ncbi:MAG: lycopene cyclase family protein, partial [Bacteroidota bacterium]
FRIDQAGEFRFVYVLPFSKKKALVEVTFFSKDICTEDVYEDILSDYMSTYYPHLKYRVTNREIGKIPMTTSPFSKQNGRIIPIGTNNATVKPSSGYAFVRIQNEVDEMAKLILEERPRAIGHRKKYIGYDKTLLNVLVTNKEEGKKIFSTMFRDNDPARVLKFLNEETSLIEEFSFFNSLPRWSFTKAWIEENVFG